MSTDTISQTRTIVTRAQAIATGASRYFTGKPCKHGHVAERSTLHRYCSQCMAEYQSTTQYQDYRAAYKARPEYNAEQAAWQRAARARPEVVAANNESKRKWRNSKPEAEKAMRQTRRALERSANGRHTGEDIKRIYSDQCGKCACCRKKVGDVYDVDHIMPLALGGTNWPSNIQILCKKCNNRKGAKHPADFQREMGMLL